MHNLDVGNWQDILRILKEFKIRRNWDGIGIETGEKLVRCESRGNKGDLREEIPKLMETCSEI